MQRSKRHLLVVGAMVLQIGFMSTAKADLIGYWPLDEAWEINEHEATPDRAPTNGPHDGVLVGDAEIIEDPTGERGNVLNLGDFDNGAGVDLPTFPQDDRSDAGINEDPGPGFIAISGSGDTGLPDVEGTQEVTISYWLNRLGAPATNQWTFLFQDGDNRQLGSHAPWGNGEVYFDVSGCCGVNQRINTSMNGAGTDGEWHHMAYVKKVNRDESDKAITVIFQDGEPIVSSPGCDLDCWANRGE